MTAITADREALDRARLAELEAEFAANPNGLYIRENLASYQRRVARHDARMPAPPPVAATSSPPAPVAAPKAPSPSREDGLRAVGKLMGATAAEIEAACQGETTPSAFLRFLTASTAVERVAERIAAAGSDQAGAFTSKEADPNSIDAVVARIAAA